MNLPQRGSRREVAALDQGVKGPGAVCCPAVVVDPGGDVVLVPGSRRGGDCCLGSHVPGLALELPVVLRDAAVGNLES